MNFWVVPGIERKESEYIIMAVCDVFETDFLTLKSKASRKDVYVLPRHFIYFMLRELKNEKGKPQMSLAECGKIFLQDHATARNAYEKMKFLVVKDNKVKEKHEAIVNKIAQLKSITHAQK